MPVASLHHSLARLDSEITTDWPRDEYPKHEGSKESKKIPVTTTYEHYTSLHIAESSSEGLYHTSSASFAAQHPE